ncbi:hypothetical protein FIBSPDRAFT_890222 [Athelia psychrophila]|uniref:Uncharacterized protein n=1 Tax=Athelia psychrophila TaxID=1759441 RepID=A0A166L542_9AGAM|nr:hypothetical protein FIBSPDRAFT_890222 [Fibularhizoctonia sp. CBS 109695]
MSSCKRKTIDPPPLYDHNQSSIPNRSYRRTGNGRHIIISSSQVPVNNQQEQDVYTPNPGLDDSVTPNFNTDHDDLYIPSNPDTAEDVGIKVTPAKHYENSLWYGGTSACDNIGIAVFENIEMAVGGNIGIAVCDNIGIAAGGNIRIAEGDSIGMAVGGDNIGMAAGDNIGMAAGGNIGMAAGDNIGMAAGGNIGMAAYNNMLNLVGLWDGRNELQRYWYSWVSYGSLFSVKSKSGPRLPWKSLDHKLLAIDQLCEKPLIGSYFWQ